MCFFGIDEIMGAGFVLGWIWMVHIGGEGARLSTRGYSSVGRARA